MKREYVYEVGDKVKIRRDLKEYEQYGGEITNHEMAQFCGATATITAANPGTGDRKASWYLIDADNEEYYWTREMFEEPVEEPNHTTAEKKRCNYMFVYSVKTKDGASGLGNVPYSTPEAISGCMIRDIEKDIAEKNNLASVVILNAIRLAGDADEPTERLK